MENDQNPLPYPSERFQRVLAFASDEADGLGHAYVDCRHLIYALSRESKGLARAVLDSLGITADMLHEQLAESAASHDRVEGQLDLADEARDAIETAAGIAQQWNHRTLDTEHVLYAIVINPTSVDEILSAFTLKPNDVLEKLYEVQKSAPTPAVREEATHAYRFNLESAWILSLAMDTARQAGSVAINSLHLLIALATLKNATHQVLIDVFGITPDKLTRQVQTNPFATTDEGRLPLAADVQRILGYAIGEAWNRGHQSVGPVHIAMGLARAERHIALDILADMGISQAMLVDELELIMPPSVI